MTYTAIISYPDHPGQAYESASGQTVQAATDTAMRQSAVNASRLLLVTADDDNDTIMIRARITPGIEHVRITDARMSLWRRMMDSRRNGYTELPISR